MKFIICAIIFVSMVWSASSFKTQMRNTVPFMRGHREILRKPTLPVYVRNGHNDMLYLVDKLLEDFKDAMGDIVSRHDNAKYDRIDTGFKTEAGTQPKTLPIFLKKRNFNLIRRSDAQSVPLVSLAVLGNMKQFFADLKNSLRTDSNEIELTTQNGSYMRHQKGVIPSSVESAQNFVFPQHMRRMMFGSQHPQYYAHSGLGR